MLTTRIFLVCFWFRRATVTIKPILVRVCLKGPIRSISSSGIMALWHDVPCTALIRPSVNVISTRIKGQQTNRERKKWYICLCVPQSDQIFHISLPATSEGQIVPTAFSLVWVCYWFRILGFLTGVQARSVGTLLDLFWFFSALKVFAQQKL